MARLCKNIFEPVWWPDSALLLAHVAKESVRNSRLELTLLD